MTLKGLIGHKTKQPTSLIEIILTQLYDFKDSDLTPIYLQAIIWFQVTINNNLSVSGLPNINNFI